MRKPISIFILITFVFVPLAFAIQSWQRSAQPPAFENFVSLTPHPIELAEPIVASSHQVFVKTTDGGWKTIWQPKGYAEKIHHILSFKEILDTLFALTANGAFRGDLRTGQWKEIYCGQSTKEKSVLSLTILTNDPEHWFLGTKAGLFESDDAGKTWFRFDRFRREPIPVLYFGKGRLFAANQNSLFVSEDLIHFKEVFTLGLQIKTDDLGLEETAMLDETDEPENEPSDNLFHLIASDKDPDTLWLATRKGVFESRNGGRTWHALSQSGLRNLEIRHIVSSRESRSLFAGTPNGVYRYLPKNQRWEELFEGMDRPEIFGLALLAGENETLVALTPGGLMEYSIPFPEIQPPSIWIPSPDKISSFRELVSLEPTAREVQEWVIRYANVRNSKIKRWQWASKLKSLIPRFSFSRDFSRGNNIDLDRGSTKDADLYIAGPDDIGYGWDWGISWELEDLIWNSAQTSIDSREKSMVELRHDLLSEVTRIYYERRRLQMDAVFVPAPTEREHFDKLIRLDELTSLLDAMTDGEFGKWLGEIYKENPELQQLWTFSAHQT